MLDLPHQHPLSIEGLSEYWIAFIDALSDYDIKYLKSDEILQTCIDIEKNHEDRERFTIDRDTWKKEKYHTHLYEVAFRYLQYWWEYITHAGLVSALRHDDVEDLKWKITFQDINKENGVIAAVCVEILTKPKTQKWQTKEERDDEYFSIFSSIKCLLEKIEEISNRYGLNLDNEQKMTIAHTAAVIKICDRIHNLLTMPEDYNEEKRERKMRQTEDYLMPLALSLWLPELRDKLVKALIKNERHKNKNKTGHALIRYKRYN